MPQIKSAIKRVKTNATANKRNAASKGLISKNKANRDKSRLSKKAANK